MMMMGRKCEDCGNQAKKECLYIRCRTCCKTKGFQCQTHIKSTWVPAYRRSHKHQSQTQPQMRSQPPSQTQPQMQSLTTPKRLREQQPLASPSSSGVPMHTTPGQFPAELSSPADFQCVRVSSVDNGKDHYAYQTTINIGGHVFKGILHDQGPDNDHVMMIDHNHHHHHHHHQESSSSPLMIINRPYTDLIFGTHFSPHQKP